MTSDNILDSPALLLSVFLYLGGFFWSLLGFNYINNQRRLIGSAIVGSGWLLSASGLLVWLWPFLRLL